MPKAYKVTRYKIKFDKNNIHDVFSVKHLLNRYSHYVKQNLQKGNAIELLGFGKLDIARQRRVLSKLLTDLKRLFPRAIIRGHCEMPGAESKACPCYKASREYRFIK